MKSIIKNKNDEHTDEEERLKQGLKHKIGHWRLNLHLTQEERKELKVLVGEEQRKEWNFSEVKRTEWTTERCSQIENFRSTFDPLQKGHFYSITAKDEGPFMATKEQLLTTATTTTTTDS